MQCYWQFPWWSGKTNRNYARVQRRHNTCCPLPNMSILKWTKHKSSLAIDHCDTVKISECSEIQTYKECSHNSAPLSRLTEAPLNQAHKLERQHYCHALVFYSNFPPLCVRPANRKSGAGLGAWSSVADYPPFLIYWGEKNVHAMVLLIRNVLFDVVVFIGLEMPISHSTTNLRSENTHPVTHCNKKNRNIK